MVEHRPRPDRRPEEEPPNQEPRLPERETPEDHVGRNGVCETNNPEPDQQDASRLHGSIDDEQDRPGPGRI
jgi:hypothetical protein